jgi:hypothetical protein
MTTLNHNEFDSNGNTDHSLEGEKHDEAVPVVNDSGFLGEDNLGDDTLDVNGFSNYDDRVEETTYDSGVEELHEEDHDVPVVGHHDEHDVAGDQPVPEALGEHRDGESVGEWLRNDWEQTKQDLHLGGKNHD